VEQAIDALGYVPNLSARSLRSRQTYTLALVVPDIANPFWTSIARGVEDTAQESGYSVLVCNTDENLAKQTGYIQTILQQRVDGMIIAPIDSNPVYLRQPQERGIATVIVDRRVDGWDGDSVRSDSVAAAYALTRHLVAVGHRRIAMITGPMMTSTARDRAAGYCLALEAAGLAVDPGLIRRGEYRANFGYMLANQLIDEGVHFSAIVAGNNAVAMGVIACLQNRSRRIPQDVALVSFDEPLSINDFYPFLTVAAQPDYEIGKHAARLALNRIRGGSELPAQQMVMPARLILRYSCGRFLHHQLNGEISFPVPPPDYAEEHPVQPLSPGEEARLRAYC
jgi:LacI family transcriptional regulator